MRFNTKIIHAGVRVDPTTGAILTPIYQSTTFVQPSVDEYLATGYSYSRTSNPTVRALEKNMFSAVHFSFTLAALAVALLVLPWLAALLAPLTGRII